MQFFMNIIEMVIIIPLYFWIFIHIIYGLFYYIKFI